MIFTALKNLLSLKTDVNVNSVGTVLITTKIEEKKYILVGIFTFLKKGAGPCSGTLLFAIFLNER
jgi:hypothetical protein